MLVLVFCIIAILALEAYTVSAAPAQLTNQPYVLERDFFESPESYTSEGVFLLFEVKGVHGNLVNFIDREGKARELEVDNGLPIEKGDKVMVIAKWIDGKIRGEIVYTYEMTSLRLVISLAAFIVFMFFALRNFEVIPRKLELIWGDKNA